SRKHGRYGTRDAKRGALLPGSKQRCSPTSTLHASCSARPENSPNLVHFPVSSTPRVVAERGVGARSSARGKQLYSRRAGLLSAKSPKHYPIELASKALAEKRAKAKAQALLLAEKKRYGLV